VSSDPGEGGLTQFGSERIDMGDKITQWGID